MERTMSSLSPEQIDRLARKRAAAKMGWFIHASVYVVVNTLLLLASSAVFGHRAWSLFPAFGWGIGLAMHGLAVFVLGGGSPLRRQLERRERDRLVTEQGVRDPW
jgi:hypothetical protein